MSIIEKYKREVEKSIKDFSLNLQEQTEEDLQNIPISSPNKLIEEIAPEQMEYDDKYEQIQFNYFATIQKTKAFRCVVCRKDFPKYTCPKCKVKYCSPQHYKTHNMFCSQRFYKEQVETQLKSMKAGKEEKKKVIEYLKKNQEQIGEDQELLMKEVQIEEISEQRLETLLNMIQNGIQLNLTQNEQKSFQKFLKQIQYAGNQLISQSVQKSDEDQLNKSFKAYIPFWLVQDGLQQYFMIEGGVQIQDYNKSQFKDIIDYRTLASKIIRQDLIKLSQLININKISIFINFDLFQIIYISALLFRTFNGDYMNSKEFVETFKMIYDDSLARKISQSRPELPMHSLTEQIDCVSLIKMNTIKLKQKNASIFQIIQGWLPIILQDCKKIIGNKFNCLQLLLRMLECLKSTQKELNLIWRDEIMKRKEEQKIKLSKRQRQDCVKLTKIIKKVQFLMSYVNEILYSSPPKQQAPILQADNKLILELIVSRGLEKEINRYLQSSKVNKAQQAQKQLKLNGILLPKY